MNFINYLGKVINMNGRMYDPLIGRMLSPDPYTHGIAGTQGFNRYSYALNNPLKFTDPSGENPIFLGMMIRAIISMYSVAITDIATGHMTSGWQFLGHMAVGTAAGAVGASIGVGAVGVLEGAVYGAASGFVGGAGSAWVRGASTSEIFRQGFRSTAICAATNGISGFLKAKRLGLDPMTGKGWVESNYAPGDFVPEGDPTGYGLDNSNLTEYAWKTFPKTALHLTYASCSPEAIGNAGMNFENHYLDGLQLMAKGEDGTSFAVEGAHIFGRNRMFNRVGSYILISPNAAGYSGNLYKAMGHELFHSFHHFSGAWSDIGQGGSDYAAYRWNASISANPSSYAEILNSLPYPITSHAILPPWVNQYSYYSAFSKIFLGR